MRSMESGGLPPTDAVAPRYRSLQMLWVRHTTRIRGVQHAPVNVAIPEDTQGIRERMY